MALTSLLSGGMAWPSPPAFQNVNPTSAFNTSGLVIDATGEKIAWIGYHWNPSRATKSIRKVGFYLGSLTKAGGSAWTLSLQDVSTTTSPAQPDGTPDQTVAISNASAVANTWYLTNALSADRSVAFGALLAVVLEFDGGGRLGADSLAVGRFGTPGGDNQGTNVMMLYTGSWASVNLAFPSVLLEYDDGTYGTLGSEQEIVSVQGSTATVNSGTTPDEVGLRFTVPVPMQVDGAYFWCYQNGASSDFEVVLYEGTTALQTVTVDATQLAQTAAYNKIQVNFSATVNLAVSTTYRLCLKPTTANSIIVPYYGVTTNAHLAVWPGGINMYWCERTDGGSFTDTTTRRPIAGLLLSGLDNGVSSGGVKIAQAMTGGFVG